MKQKSLNLFLLLLDILFLIMLFYMASYIRCSIESITLPHFNEIHIKDFSFYILIITMLLYYENIYTLKYDFWQESLKIMKSFVLGFFLTLTMLALTKTNLEYSRLFIVIYFTLGMLFMPIFKRYVKKLLYKFEFFKTKTLVIGVEDEVKIFAKELKDNWYLGQVYSETNYSSVIIVSKGLCTGQLNDYISTYIQETRELFIVPYITDINFAHSNILEYSNIRYNTIQVENKLLIKKNIWLKNLFDKIMLIVLLPLFVIMHLILSVLIKLDSSGPVFFKQARLGKDDKDFVCYKYRTMYENSEELLENYLKENPDERIYYDTYHKYKNDPRITKIGAFLRSSSLDEFAQIINILKGEMSFVGPRPYMLKESCKLGENQEFILKVKPGITGLWQVSGRNELTFKERNDLEVWYIKNWSLWADFVILVKTIKVVLNKVGAK